MPKISTNRIQVQNNDIYRNFDVVVFYDSNIKFFAKIPAEFSDIESLLSDEERTAFSIKIKKEEKIINDATEEGCLSKFRKCIDAFFEKSITKRDVIIVYYSMETNANWHTYKFDPAFPKIALNYGLTFSEEIFFG